MEINRRLQQWERVWFSQQESRIRLILDESGIEWDITMAVIAVHLKVSRSGLAVRR